MRGQVLRAVDAPRGPRRRLWVGLAAGGGAAAFLVAFAIRQSAGIPALPLAVGALPVWLGIVLALWRHASRSPAGERASEGAGRSPERIGFATGITLVRGFLISLVAGCLWLSPAASSVVSWLPGPLYALAALCDRWDGAIARRTGTVTALGAWLDVNTDALGLLCAPLLGVVWGRLPPWYLLLSGAYYLLRAGLWLRRRLGLPAFPERLRPDPRARLFAGVQMVTVAVALFPVLPARVTWPAASLAMLPTLALFVGEWRIACGAEDRSRQRGRRAML